MSFDNQQAREGSQMLALIFRWQVPLPRCRALLLTAAVCLFVGAAAVGVLGDGHVHALQAAGAFKGTPIGGVQNFVEKLKGSLVWLGYTMMGFVIAVIALMFMAGHSRAHDLVIKTGAGLMILASISGIVA